LKNKAIIVFSLFTLIAVLFVSVSYGQPQRVVQPRAQSIDANLLNTLSTVRNLIGAGDYDRALGLLMSLKKTYGERPEINDEIKNIYRLKKDYVSLKAMVQNEIKAHPDSFDIICQLGEIYFLTDSLNQAKQTWGKALGLAGNFDYRYMMLAGYYRAYGFYDEAAAVFRKGRVILKRPELFTDDLIDIFISQQNYKEAIAEYLNKLRFDQSAAEDISTQIAQLDTGSIKPEEIKQELNKAIKNSPKDPLLYGLMGDIDARLGNLKAAYDSYKQADRLSGSKGNFIYGFTKICFDRGNYAMVIQAADEYLPKFSEPGIISMLKLIKARSLAGLNLYPQAFALLDDIQKIPDARWQTEATFAAGDLYENKLNKPDSAIQEYSRAASSRTVPTLANQASLRLGEIYIKLGDYAKALSWLNPLVQSGQSRDLAERASFLKAEIAFYKYDFDNALDQYKALTATFPTGVYVNDCLDRMALLNDAAGDSTAYFMADAMRFRYRRHPDSAVAAVEKAAKIAGSGAAQFELYSLAQFYEDTKNWPKAAETYEQYLSRYPDGLYIDRAIYALGVVYYEKLKQPDKADALFNRLLTSYPLSPLLEKARAYLNKIKTS